MTHGKPALIPALRIQVRDTTISQSLLCDSRSNLWFHTCRRCRAPSAWQLLSRWIRLGIQRDSFAFLMVAFLSLNSWSSAGSDDLVNRLHSYNQEEQDDLSEQVRNLEPDSRRRVFTLIWNDSCLSRTTMHRYSEPSSMAHHSCERYEHG